MSITIETARLLLRNFTDTDAKETSDNSRRPIVAHYLSDMVFETEKDALDWIYWINNDKFNLTVPNIVLAIEMKTSHKCIGLIGVAPKHELGDEIEILFLIADEYQNQGYVTEAGNALIKWAFKNTPIKYLVAIVKHDNGPSNSVIKKLGFQYSGERSINYDGKMTEFHYYQLKVPQYKIISIKNHPEYALKAVDWFASKWGIDRKEYEQSMGDCLHQNAPLPRWYLALDEEGEIVGGCGLILNDFVDRTDLFPYVCALFVEQKARGHALGAALLENVRRDGAKLGFHKLYLCTDHTAYYEKYNWNYIGTGKHPWGSTSRIYEAHTIEVNLT